MQSRKRILVLLFAVSISAAVITTAALRRQEQVNSDQSAQQNIPVADYSNPEPTDPEKRAFRRIRGGRHTRGNKQLIKELPPGTEELPLNANWWWGLPALPVTKSDTIVVGEVTDAQAYLSSDKTDVYSEFVVRTDEILKNGSSAPLMPSSSITLERSGGAVRFKSGRIQQYRIAKQGLPRIGRRYVFFLKHNEDGQDFSILTAYELRAGRVFPLDSAGSSASKLPFDQYADYEESSFLNAVQSAVANSSRVLPEKGSQN